MAKLNEELFEVLEELDTYAAPIKAVEPVGTVAVPIRLLQQIHRALGKS